MDHSNTSPKCLICFRSIQSELSKNSDQFAIVFDIFCRLLKVDLIKSMQWHFEQDPIPFCEFCSSAVDKLNELYDQIESLQEQTTCILSRIKHEIQTSGSDANTTNELTANNRVNYFRHLVVGGSTREEDGIVNAEVTSLNVDSKIEVETKLDRKIEFSFLDRMNESSEFENADIESDPLVTVTVKQEDDSTTDCVVHFESFPHDNLETATELIFQDSASSVQKLDIEREEIKADLEDHQKYRFCSSGSCRKMGTVKSDKNNLSEVCEKGDESSEEFSSPHRSTCYKRIHTGGDEMKHKCDYCDKRFSERCLLIRHRRSHTGEKPFKCEACNKRFSRLDVLTIHKRIHTGERPYICDICNKSFSHSRTLMEHKRMHSGEKPYECEVCFKAFSLRRNLTRHRKRHSEQFY